MSTTLIFLFLSTFAILLEPIAGNCKVSKPDGAGFGNTVKCWNATIDEAMRNGGNVVAEMTIQNSRIVEVSSRAFSAYGRNLQSLILQNCEIRQLHSDAFGNLTFLKRLNLPNNNITVVQTSWFDDLVSLEQLDLSFNAIRHIHAGVYAKLTNLRRLNLDDNQLTCLEPKDMEPMRSITKIRVLENPLSFLCRARMTLWFNDKGTSYTSDRDQKSGSWLDRVLWLCAEDDYVPTNTELRMHQCVLLNMFNQLRSSLTTTKVPERSRGECAIQRRTFTSCISGNGRDNNVTNGEAATNMIIALSGAQKILHLPEYL